MAIRVRFAPSPTGPLHIGGVRTALFNYLYARRNEGVFVLRIEDTDRTRFVPEAEQYIKESLDWAGISPDESPWNPGEYGPYRQSERKDIYIKYLQELIQKGKAYYAFDTQEELQLLRDEAEKEGANFKYTHKNREGLSNSLELSPAQLQEKLDSGIDYVVRFMVPKDETIQMNDRIRNEISVESSEIDDKILMKSDGMPTYHFANIVDDHLMEITHVIRGEEWLPSMPLHVLLYKAFGWDAPQFAHLPLILKPEGKGKLSKRDGDKLGFPVFPIEWTGGEEGDIKGYREEGYLPEAFINMLALLGWNPGTEQELFSLSELEKQFSFDGVNKSGARFNKDKAIWFNHEHLKNKSNEEILPKFQEILKSKSILLDNDFDLKLIELLRERANFISDIWDEASFFYKASDEFDAKGLKKIAKGDPAGVLKKFSEEYKEAELTTSEENQQFIKDFVTKHELGFGKVMMPLRLALVGELTGPDVPVILKLLAKDEVLSRIDKLSKVLQEA